MSTYVDTVLEKVCKNLGVEIMEYSKQDDPTKQGIPGQEWTIQPEWVKEIDKKHTAKLKAYREGTKKRKSEGGAVTDKGASDEEEKKKEKIDD